MKPAAFDYVAATSLEEALAALAAGGDDAKPIAGGQSLVPALNLRLIRPTLLVDLNRAGLDAIVETERVTIGATVRQAAAARDPRVHPLLREALPHVGHVATRNRGTVGGSVAHADGAAEIPVCLTALAGTIEVAGPEGRRSLMPDELFVTHYTTTLAAGELVTATTWPRPASDEGFAFEELALRAGDYGLAIVAVALRRVEGRATDVRVAVGAVTDAPTRLLEAEAALVGTPVDSTALAAAVAAARAAVEPPGTIHADPGYLRHLTGVLVERAARRAWERAA
ncbi:MAG: FAD binding domain-containing protein [Gaiellales bacterium]